MLSEVTARLRLLTALAILGVVASAAAKISKCHSSSWDSVGQGIEGALDIWILLELAVVIDGVLE